MTTKARLFLASPLFLSLALGCGSGNVNTSANVSGKVTYHDQPVTNGIVTFQPKDGGPLLTCPIAPDGTYTASNLPVGDMVATIETESVNPANPKPVYGPKDANPTSPMPSGGASGGPVGAYVKIPAKYNDLKKPLLPVTLTAGKQTKDFPLTD